MDSQNDLAIPAQDNSDFINNLLHDHNLQGLPSVEEMSFFDTDATKNNQLNLCLESLLDNSPFGLPISQEADPSTNLQNINDLFNPSISSGSRSSYSLTNEAFRLDGNVDLPMLTEPEASPGQGSVIDMFPALEAWPIFECDPIMQTNHCPTTATDHLRTLYRALSDQDICCKSNAQTSHAASIEPFVSGTRDKLIAIVQRFSDKAQRVHGLLSSEQETNEVTAPFFFILPAPSVLDSLLSACLGSYELHYPFLSAVSMKTNQLLDKGSDQVITSLKLLLMMAAGAMTPAASHTHRLAHGLLEICRVFLSHLVEEDMRLASNSDLLQCALGFNIIAAWSGDKWQMDVAIYQKAMYIEILRRSRLFEQPSPSVPLSDSAAELMRVWRDWQEQESKNRTAYTWLILDQEMCLFQDSTSTLFTSGTDFNISVPSSDRVWRATSAEQWAREMRHLDGGTITFPPSLNEHVKRFRALDTAKDVDTFVPTTLRLLLCHLQKIVSQVRAMIVDIGASGATSKATRHHTSMVLVSVHMDEAQDMLQKWYSLASHRCTDHESPAMGATLVLYHLVSLNTLTNFPDVERFARNDDNVQFHESSRWLRSHHFEDHHRIFFHCGQVLRTIRSMPEHTRPAWWAGAVYRVALIAWANSISLPDASMEVGEHEHKEFTHVVLDELAPDHSLIEAYLDRHEGIPVFSRLQGGHLSLDVPGEILVHLASVLGTDPQLTFVKGVQLKLLKLAARWQQSTPTRT
ncbi:transcription factor Bmr1, partial [Aureobasidium melanogenum]